MVKVKAWVADTRLMKSMPHLARAAVSWKGFAAGVTALFIASMALLVYWGGEWVRHCARDCGDMGGRGLAFGWGLASLLVPIGGTLVRLSFREAVVGTWPRRLVAATEAAVGAMGALWLIAALAAPALAVIAIPLGLINFAVAGGLVRRLGENPPVAVRRYGPYFVTAVAAAGLLAVGIWLVGWGGACHEYAAADWSGCNADGSIVVVLPLIGIVTAGTALLINLGFKLRSTGTPPGWVLAIPVGLLLACATVASHFVG